MVTKKGSSHDNMRKNNPKVAIYVKWPYLEIRFWQVANLSYIFLLPPEPLAKFGYVLLCMIANAPTLQIWKQTPPTTIVDSNTNAFFLMKLLLEAIGPKWNKKKEKKSEKRKGKKEKTKTTVSLDSLCCFCWNCVASFFLCLLSLRSRVGIGSPSSFVGVLIFVPELSDLVILSSNITQIFFCDPEGVSFTKIFSWTLFWIDSLWRMVGRWRWTRGCLWLSFLWDPYIG
jgi:hypothetical protein